MVVEGEMGWRRVGDERRSWNAWGVEMLRGRWEALRKTGGVGKALRSPGLSPFVLALLLVCWAVDVGTPFIHSYAPSRRCSRVGFYKQ